MTTSNSKLKFVIGILFIILSWLISLNIFLLLVSIPLFIVGAILVLLSDKKLLVKIITIILPVVLWFAAWGIMGYFIQQKDSIAVVLPNKFSGQARVVFGESNGIIPGELNNEMQLVIPENGILIIKPHFDSDLEHITFYGTDEKGEKFKMNSKIGDSANRPYAYFEGLRSSESLNSNIASELDYIYASFFVLQNDSDKVESYVEEKKNNALNDSLVKVCRKNKLQ